MGKLPEIGDTVYVIGTIAKIGAEGILHVDCVDGTANTFYLFKNNVRLVEAPTDEDT